MLRCPACGELGLFEHSVIVSLAAVRAARGLEGLACYVRCRECEAVHRRDADGVRPIADDDPFDPDGAVLWLRPPWVAEADGEFEASWDLAESFFERLAGDLPHIAFVGPFLRALRDAGYGPRLRAGQSLSTLVLSRSRAHGLRDDQSALSLMPGSDGTFHVDGAIGGHAVSRDRVPPIVEGWLAERLEALAAVPID